MKVIKEENLSGERALFNESKLHIIDSVFENGESPLKEASDIKLDNCSFKWKYPLWYANNIELNDSYLFEMGRSGIWYTSKIKVNNSIIYAPKAFRRSSNIKLNNVYMPNALETMWNCDHIEIKNSNINGDYFGMNSSKIEIENINLTGNYSFDGCTNVIVKNSKIMSKDAFWNAQNITVYDSVISGEYIGWNSANLKFVNCTIESLQGLCYIDNIELVNCKLINTTGAFEYCTVKAEVTTTIDSIINPISGTIKAPKINNIIFDDDDIDPINTVIKLEE